MGELRLKIPEEFEDKIKELPKMEDMVVDFIRLKIFDFFLTSRYEKLKSDVC